MRLIDADKLDDKVNELNEHDWGITRNEYKIIDRVLFEMPTVDAIPRERKGESDMRKPVRPSEVIDREEDGICEIIHDDAPVSPCFGIESWKINKAGIDALLHGESLYFDVNDGEYAVILHYCE